MPIVTNPESRAQTGYGSFAPRADTRRFGVIYAAIGDGGDGRFPHMDTVQTVGLPIGDSGKNITYEPWYDADGKPHDVTLPNGVRVREMITGIEDIQAASKIEGALSEARMEDYSRDRHSEDGRVHLTGSITERQLASTTMAHDPALREHLAQQQASPSAPRPKTARVWTSEQKAAAGARMAAARAAKKPATA